MVAVLYKVDPVIIKLSMKMIFVISAACLLGSIHASSRGAAVTTGARGEVNVGDDTYEEILDINGEPVRYGENFTLWLPDLGFGFLRFSFGLGGAGVVVQTDVQTTLMNAAGRTFLCQDNGILDSVPSDGGAPSSKSLVRVRLNADGTYQLQITEETPPVFVQFQYVSVPSQCQRGVEGSRVRFQVTSSSRSKSHRQAQPATEHHPTATPIIPYIQLPTST